MTNYVVRKVSLMYSLEYPMMTTYTLLTVLFQETTISIKSTLEMKLILGTAILDSTNSKMTSCPHLMEKLPIRWKNTTIVLRTIIIKITLSLT